MISAIFEVTYMNGEQKVVTIPNCNMYDHKDLWQTALDSAMKLRKDGIEVVKIDLIAF